MIDMLANLQPEYIGLVMIACMLFAILSLRLPDFVYIDFPRYVVWSVGIW